MISIVHRKQPRRVPRLLLWSLIIPLVSVARADVVKIRLDRSADQLQLVFLWDSPAGFTHAAEGRELLLRFDRAAEIAGLDQLPAAAPDWIESASGGYDTLLLRAVRDVVYSVHSADKELIVNLVPLARVDEREGLEEQKSQLRLDLLEARWNSDAGHFRNAAHLLSQLVAKHPDDPDVLMSLANFESQVGRWRRASELFNRVLLLSPDNEEVMEAKARLQREQGTQTEVEFMHKTVADSWQEHLMRSTGQVLFGNYLRTGIAYDHNQVQTGTMRRANGEVGDYDGSRHRAEVYLQHHLERGAQITGSLFLDDLNRGFGIAVANPDLKGQSRLVVDYHRPYWEFVEGLVGGGVRDKIEAYREQKLAQRLNGWLAGTLNRYGLEGNSSAAQSMGFNGGLNYLVAKKPIVILQYGFDGEYRTAIQSRTDSSGALYYPIPLVSREVHTADVAVSSTITRTVRIDGFAGYAVDRFGGNGPYLGMRVTASLSKALEAQVDFDRRLNSINTGEVVNRLTGRLIWKIGR